MESFQELIENRRSIRKYSDKKLESSQVELILKSGLLSPSSRNKKSWEFVLVEEPEMLEKLARCKKSGSKPILNCALAIIVLADPLVSDVWIEDASVVSTIMMLQAEDLGLGSCWIQVRERHTVGDDSSEQYVRDLFSIPLHMQVLSVLAIGYKSEENTPKPVDDNELQWEKIHIDKY